MQEVTQLDVSFWSPAARFCLSRRFSSREILELTRDPFQQEQIEQLLLLEHGVVSASVE